MRLRTRNLSGRNLPNGQPDTQSHQRKLDRARTNDYYVMTFSYPCYVRMANSKLLIAVALLITLCFSRHASAECNYDSADQYNGWGWDPVNRQSCPPLAGECEDRGGYPWGWNPVTLTSCRLDAQTTDNSTGQTAALVPANSRFSLHLAPTLPFSQNQATSLPPDTHAHYYRIDLEQPMALQLEGELDSELEAAIGGMYKFSHSYSLNLGEPARCFTSGTYYVIVVNWGNDTDRPYNINVTAKDQQCVNSVASAVNNEHPDGDWYVDWTIGSDGTVFARPVFWTGITAYDQNGDILWSKGELYPIAAPDRLSDGSTAVLSREHRLRLLDNNGDFLWTIDLADTEFPRLFTDLIANDDTILLFNATEVASFNSHDGSLRWRYSPQDRIRDVTVANNNKVLVFGDSNPNLGIYYLNK